MKSIEKKQVLKSIQEELENGKSRDEILQGMSNTHHEKLSVGKLIACIPDPNAKRRFRLLNNVLILLFFLLIIVNICEGFQLIAEKPYLTSFSSLVVLLFTIYFVNGLIKFRGYIYSELTQFIVLIIIIEIDRIYEFNIWVIAQAILLLLILGVAVFLRRRIFSNYGFFGLKKGKDGYYLLG